MTGRPFVRSIREGSQRQGENRDRRTFTCGFQNASAPSGRCACGIVTVALTAMVALLGALPASAQPFPTNACAADRGVDHLNCTANDIEIATFEVLNGVTECTAGETVTLDLVAHLHVNAQDRHDVGLFLALDGKPPILPAASGGSANCVVVGVPMSPVPFADLDGNACGDFDRDGLPQGTIASVPLGLITLTCAPDQTGHLTIPSVVTWHENASDCQSPPAAYLLPGSPAKCEAGVGAQIPVLVQGRISVTKQTIPDAAAGTFAFSATGTGVSPTGFNLTDNQNQVVITGPLGQTAQTYTIAEQALAGFDPTAQIVCVDPDGDARPEFVTINPATRTVSVKMSANGTVGLTYLNCVFTNTRQGSITIVKNTVGGDGIFNFTNSQNFSINTAGGTGQRVLSNLNPGTYTVSETIPAGWDLTSLLCNDPSGDTTVSGSTATINVAAGENVTCTFTDTKRGSINISKTTLGGDGTFSFVGPGPTIFQITTSGGSGGPHTFANLPPGTYTVTETSPVPAGWDLAGIDCTDATGGTTTSVASGTATIDLAPGDVVSCTYTDKRRASITVEKLAAGGDGTFSFSGSQTFSITTTSGSGQNTSAFASVPEGVLYTITEDALAGWSPNGAACRDATTGLPVGTPGTSSVSVTPAPGQNVICTFNDVKLATLRIFKHSQPSDAQSFTFTASSTLIPTPPHTFSLSDGGADPSSITFANLTPGSGGTYTVTETAVTGWVLTALHCSDLGDPDPSHRSTVNLATGTVDAHLGPGETLDCTFTNTRIQNGSITVTKHAVGGDGTFAFTNSGGVSGSSTNPDAFSISTSGLNHTGTQPLTGLTQGTYTITEAVPASGWDLVTPINCVVTSGTSTTITQTTNGVTIVLGLTNTSVDAVACEFTDIKRGSITIAKSATPSDPTQQFDFATTSTPATTPLDATFQITDSGTKSYSNLVPATYTVTESTLPSGWRFSDISCTGGSVVTKDPATRTVTIELQAGENVSCTFTNVKDGAITITKTAVGGTGSETFTFTGALSGTISNGGSVVATLPPGTYATTELVTAGWDLTNIVCTGGTVTITGAAVNPTDGFEPGDTTVNVTIAAGETVACTYTDTKRGSITIVKNTVGGDGTFDFGGDRSFQIVTSSGTGQDATTFAAVVPGTYVVTESVPTGWSLTGLTCSNSSVVDRTTATATVSVAAGEQVTCTFTDTRLGTITITKRIGGDETEPFHFTVPTSLDPAGSFTLTPPIDVTTESRVFQNVAPGSYTVAESPIPTGWILSSIVCVDPTNNTTIDLPGGSATINLAAGESVECTFENISLAEITISAVSTGGTGTFAFQSSGFGLPTFNLTTTSEGIPASQVFGSLPPGTYVVEGLGAPGWQLYQVLCISDGGETYWTIVGGTTTISLSHGEEIECIYYFRPPSPIIVPKPPPPVPVLEPKLIAVLVVCLMLVATRAIRPH